VNIRDDQYWHMTKVPPAMPMNRRRTARVAAELISPVQAVGIDAAQRTTVKRMRAPYLSHAGPRRKRMNIVPATPTILDVQISSLVSFSVIWISDKRGVIENHMKKAMKNDHHAQWKARM